MIWTAPAIELHSLKIKAQHPNDEVELEVAGLGLRQGVTQLVFVRASSTASDGLKPYEVIPCRDLTPDPNGAEKATFRASLYERESGAYHLVACNPPTGTVNQTAVLEWALAVAALPGQPVVVDVKK